MSAQLNSEKKQDAMYKELSSLRLKDFRCNKKLRPKHLMPISPNSVGFMQCPYPPIEHQRQQLVYYRLVHTGTLVEVRVK